MQLKKAYIKKKKFYKFSTSNKNQFFKLEKYFKFSITPYLNKKIKTENKISRYCFVFDFYKKKNQLYLPFYFFQGYTGLIPFKQKQLLNNNFYSYFKSFDEIIISHQNLNFDYFKNQNFYKLNKDEFWMFLNIKLLLKPQKFKFNSMMFFIVQIY
jgi:hypothetical protein